MTPLYQLAMLRAAPQVWPCDVAWLAEKIDLELRLAQMSKRFEQAEKLRANRVEKQEQFEDMREWCWLHGWDRFTRAPQRKKIGAVFKELRIAPYIRTGSTR